MSQQLAIESQLNTGGGGVCPWGGGVRPREDTFLMGLCAGKLSAEVFVGNIDFLTVRDGREV